MTLLVLLDLSSAFDTIEDSILLGPVVRTPVSANPGLNFNQGFFFFSSKALSQMIFYIFLEYSIIKL